MKKAKDESEKILKIRVFKVRDSDRYYEERDHTPSILQGITKWTEMTVKEYQELQNAVSIVNQGKGYGVPKSDGYRFFVLQQVETFEEIFNSAKEFVAYHKKRKEAGEAKEAERKKKAEATKLERKRKQLEKLKKELAEGKL